MKGWTGLEWLEKIEDEYLSWLQIPDAEKSTFRGPDGFQYGKIGVIKQVKNKFGSGLKETKDLVDLWERASSHVGSGLYVLSLDDMHILDSFGYSRLYQKDFRGLTVGKYTEMRECSCCRGGTRPFKTGEGHIVPCPYCKDTGKMEVEMPHPSHKMTEWRPEILAPCGTPRF